jgi:o-succinylbenzoate synthase
MIAPQVSLRRCSGGTLAARAARQAWPERAGVLLEIVAGAHRGLGEASPLPGYSTDTLEQAEGALASLDLQALALALEQEHPLEALAAVGKLVPAGQSAARMALETAVLDLRGRQCGRSAPMLLAQTPGAERTLAWLAGVLVGGDAESQTLPAIRRAMRGGYAHFKLKLGVKGKLREELAVVHGLRGALGSAVRLRLDANQAWSEADARAACGVLEDLDIEFLEEPCSAPLRALHTRIPIALDESLRDRNPQDLASLARRSSASIVILKPMVHGGLTRCLAMARQALDLGLGVVISHSFDGPVALVAAAALALAVPTRMAQGLAPHAGLAAWPDVPLPIAGGKLRAWTSPGLGSATELIA